MSVTELTISDISDAVRPARNRVRGDSPACSRVSVVAEAYASNVEVVEIPRQRWTSVTRAIDVTVALGALVVMLPLLLAIAIAIGVTSRCSPIYRQVRVGRDGAIFHILKFRTMVRDAELNLAQILAQDSSLADEFARTCKLRNDPRITRIGRVLRPAGLDELPQLANVVMGDMSLVGPRPVPAAELLLYGERAALVTSVRPGITGLWQISDRSDCMYLQRVLMDSEYVKTRTIVGDLGLIARTGSKFLAGRLGGS